MKEIILKQEKIDAMIKFLKRKEQPKEKDDLEKLTNHMNYLYELRKPIFVNDNFSKEEYSNTLYYAENLLEEKYEQLSKFNYKII